MRHHPAPTARPALVAVWVGRECHWVVRTAPAVVDLAEAGVAA